ncbi:MAG: methylmalonyl-CoA epimerase [Myxococcales bacterium]|nr:methylmalonyl-CoA epimerase [Myxococcales bacterium]
MIKKLDHIAIAVRNLEEASKFYTEHLGLSIAKIEEVPTEKVRVAFIQVGDVWIELLEPTADDSPISKFLEKRGEGLHHLCLQTDQVAETITELHDHGVRMLDEKPRPGAKGTQVAFVHPKANAGVLTELVQYPEGEAH